MTLSEARYLADSIIAKLVPVTERCMIGGSIRRKKNEVSDIDIILIPRRDEIKDMFGIVIAREPCPEFIATINQWTKIKGDATGKYTQRLVKGGHMVEFSICKPDNWGNITLIRTGDADFTHMIMKRVLKMGYRQEDGYLWEDAKKIPLTDERQYFELLNLPYIEPEHRNKNAFRLSAR